MIGFVLTGHGSFPEGVLGAAEMIAGPQRAFEAVAFQEDEALDVFEKRLTDAVAELKKSCEEVVIFSDLMGGTPFRSAMLTSQAFDKVEVVAGTNLPVLIECIGLRYSDIQAAALIEQGIATGQAGLVHAKLPVAAEVTEEEEGI